MKWFHTAWGSYMHVGSGALLPNDTKVTMDQLRSIHSAWESFPAFIAVCKRLSYQFSLDDCEFWVCEVRKTWKDTLPPYRGAGQLTTEAVKHIRHVFKATSKN